MTDEEAAQELGALQVAETLLDAIDHLEELSNRSVWWQSGPYRELEHREAYRQGQLSEACKTAARAVHNVFIRMQDSHTAHQIWVAVRELEHQRELSEIRNNE